MAPTRPRESGLLDALTGIPPVPITTHAWRVVRDGSDPLQCSAAGGRWDDRTFDVLYTSTARDGALSEMYFHLARGQPVFPSQVRYRLFELEIRLDSCLRLQTLDALAGLGVNTAAFGQLSYAEREREYPQTQDIAEAAHFIGHDGIMVPSARAPYGNVVVFSEPAGPGAVGVVRDHGLIDWTAWRRDHPGGSSSP